MAGYSDVLHRTHTCGGLRGADAGKTVILTGWVATKRDLGGCVFVDLRDRHGITQVIFDPASGPVLFGAASALKPESVIGTEGIVTSRGANVNRNMPTGEIEVRASRLEVFARAETTPFSITDNTNASDELRLKYRYLDLRRRPAAEAIIQRHKIAKAVRDHLDREGFLEVETPFLTRSTPEGARDYLVPSRVNPGKFYALPQSPQLFKQLLMVAGMDRYFQIVRCFRDEDLRADRQPEFTQVDMEMSFADEDSIAGLTEGMLHEVFRTVKGIDIPRPFPRLTWDEAMSGYGCDKPDLRFDLKLRDVTEIARKHGGGGAGLVSETLEKGGVIKVLPVPSAHPLSRADVDRLEGQLKQLGSPGLARAKVEAAGWAQAGWARETAPGMRSEIEAACGAKPGDLLLFQFGAAKDVNQWLCALRLALGKKFGLMKDGVFAFCWVTEFPLLEYSEEEKKWTATHHPFTSPRISDLDRLESDPGSVKALAYDVVLNGFELGGGSIRIHDPALQSRMFGALGISREEARAKFGFLLEAFRYGPPPHGGIALGLDRLAMIISGAESLRDVIAFPKTARAVCLMTEAPSAIDPGQLDELGIAARPAKG